MHKGAKILENHLNPVMLVFIGKFLLSTLRGVSMCHGFSHLSDFLHHFVLAKLATSSIKVNHPHKYLSMRIPFSRRWENVLIRVLISVLILPTLAVDVHAHLVCYRILWCHKRQRSQSGWGSWFCVCFPPWLSWELYLACLRYNQAPLGRDRLLKHNTQIQSISEN